MGKKMETRDMKGMGGSHVVGYSTKKSKDDVKGFYLKRWGDLCIFHLSCIWFATVRNMNGTRFVN